MHSSGRNGSIAALSVVGLVGLFLAAPAAAQASDGDTARIDWRLTPGETIRYEISSTTDIASADSSTSAVAATYEAVLRLQPRSCSEPPAAACDAVAVAFEREVHSVRLPDRPPIAARDLAQPDDPVTLAQRSDGGWQAVADGSSIAAGHMVEQLADALPLTFPAGAVTPGDRWPIGLGATRDNRRLGRIEFSIDGKAALDSLVGTRAWISVTATDSADSRAWSGASTVRGSFEWDLVAGALVEGTVERAGTLDRPLPNGATRRSEVRSRLRIRRLPETRTEPARPTS